MRERIVFSSASHLIGGFFVLGSIDMLHPVDGHPELVWDDERPVDFKPNVDMPNTVIFKTKLKDGKKITPNNKDETIEVNIHFDEWKKLIEQQRKTIERKGNSYIVR